MSDMKLIMENWRQYQLPPRPLNEAVTIDTLKQLVSRIIQIKKAIEGGEIAADAGGKILSAFINVVTLGAVPAAKAVLDGAISAGKLAPLAKAGRLPDTDTDKAPFLDVFNVSDEYSKILDDRIENAFVNHLAAQLEGGQLDNVDLATWDINAYLEEWLKARYNDKAVSGAPPNQIDVNKMQQALGGLKKGGAWKAFKSLISSAAG
jgi:hypothetical protein|tara:strand:+ start:457 stop:1074 length:618 start_codon:yes stop_codon:yes gene_type:complete